MKINIFVACHKPSLVRQNPLLIPIQVGAALQPHLDGMWHDDEGDNISEKNPYYCELTAQYWAWKNRDCDYYGFCHYRRYFDFTEVYPVLKGGGLSGVKNPRPYIELDDIRQNLNSYGLDSERMRHVIESYDIVTVLRERINTTVYRQYCQFHEAEPLNTVLEITKQKYPEYTKAVEQYMDSKNIYYMNMYIMKKEMFRKYMSWLFDILETYENKVKTTDALQMQARLMGYLAERLFGVFYTYQREHGAACAELAYLMFYNTEKEQKGGRKTQVRVFRLKPTKLELKIDMRRLNRIFPPGSRRRMLLRGLFVR